MSLNDQELSLQCCNDICCQNHMEVNNYGQFMKQFQNEIENDENLDDKNSDFCFKESTERIGSIDKEMKRLKLMERKHKSGIREDDDACNNKYDDSNGLSSNDKQIEIVVSPLIVDDDSIMEISRDDERGVYYRRFCCEDDLQLVIELITKDLSEPYSIYTYRYFIYNWPRMCIMAFTLEGQCIGAIVGKTERYQDQLRGYIAMLAVQEEHRRKMIGSRLVELVIDTMIAEGQTAMIGCSEIVLETEVTNTSALRLYEKLGFVRDKRLFRYYLNGVDAYRLKLWLS